jgi:hypothetical protein
MNEGEKRLLTRNAKAEQQERDDDNLTVERPTFVTHLECSATGERYPADDCTICRVPASRCSCATILPGLRNP